MTTVARFPQALCCSDLERLPTYQPVHDEQPSQLPPQLRSSPAGGFGSLRGGKRLLARLAPRPPYASSSLAPRISNSRVGWSNKLRL